MPLKYLIYIMIKAINLSNFMIQQLYLLHIFGNHIVLKKNGKYKNS